MCPVLLLRPLPSATGAQKSDCAPELPGEGITDQSDRNEGQEGRRGPTLLWEQREGKEKSDAIRWENGKRKGGGTGKPRGTRHRRKEEDAPHSSEG